MPRKILQEMRISRDEDGAHVIEHRHAEPPNETRRFKSGTQAVQHVLANIHKLEPKDLPQPDTEEQEESEPGRPASFDYSSRGGSAISGRRK
jgi:hypothetical protein